MAFAEYPKALYGPRGWGDLDDCRRVFTAEEEAQARAEGYRCLSEDAAAPLPPSGNVGATLPEPSLGVAEPVKLRRGRPRKS